MHLDPNSEQLRHSFWNGSTLDTLRKKANTSSALVPLVLFPLAVELETLFLGSHFVLSSASCRISSSRGWGMMLYLTMVFGSIPVQMALSGAFLRTQEIHRTNALVIGQKVSHFPASWGQMADAPLFTVRLGPKYSKARLYKVFLPSSIQPCNNNFQCITRTSVSWSGAYSG